MKPFISPFSYRTEPVSISAFGNSVTKDVPIYDNSLRDLLNASSAQCVISRDGGTVELIVDSKVGYLDSVELVFNIINGGNCLISVVCLDSNLHTSTLIEDKIPQHNDMILSYRIDLSDFSLVDENIKLLIIIRPIFHNFPVVLIDSNKDILLDTSSSQIHIEQINDDVFVRIYDDMGNMYIDSSGFSSVDVNKAKDNILLFCTGSDGCIKDDLGSDEDRISLSLLVQHLINYIHPTAVLLDSGMLPNRRSRLCLRKMFFHLSIYSLVTSLFVLLAFSIRSIWEASRSIDSYIFALSSLGVIITALGINIHKSVNLSKPFKYLIDCFRRLIHISGRDRDTGRIYVTCASIIIFCISVVFLHHTYDRYVSTEISCSILKKEYSYIVNSQIEGEEINIDRLAEAWVMFPQRLEIPTMLNSVLATRRSTISELGDSATLFVDSPIISVLVENIKSDKKPPTSKCLNPNEPYNPLLLYAQISAEALNSKHQRNGQLDVASLLDSLLELAEILETSGHSDEEAKILAKIYRITVANQKHDHSSVDRYLSDLMSMTSNPQGTLDRSHTYLEALDAIGQALYNRCDANDEFMYFRRLMSHRSKISKTNSHSWVKPPDKLNLYHMWLGVASSKSIDYSVRKAGDINRIKLACPAGIKALVELYSKDPKYDWYAGTIFSTPLRGIVEKQLHNNWRY